MTPLFKSHYSIGKSILTLEEEGSSMKNGPQSIIDLCKEAGIKDLYLVEDSMSGFLQGYINSKESKLNFRFGLRLNVCGDLKEKNEDSLNKTSKVVIFANNQKGYKRLIKISTQASQEGFYYQPRTDYKALAKHWNDKDLTLAVPFYDSFLHRNALHGAVCVPDFGFAKNLVFFEEENDIPFNFLIKNHLKEYVNGTHETLKVKSIFYPKKEDFKAYLTFRCINKRTTLDKPNLEHMTSNEFCLESWSEANAS
tara:strand:- start:16416 stop:17174 length:759 start_codon:yes stop_codon:yes gene_type:complete